MQVSVDGQRRQTTDEATDVRRLEAVRSSAVQQVRRQTTDEQRSEHIEHIAPFVDIRHVEASRPQAVDTHVESLVSGRIRG